LQYYFWATGFKYSLEEISDIFFLAYFQNQIKMHYLFYDYETTGIDKRFDQIVQFAAIKTDSNFNELERHDILCRMRNDIIPSPYAFRTTMIDVKNLQENGLDEFDFSKKVNKILSGNGNQCITGYNSKEFDDKFSQFLLYRNLADPYLWAWDKGNKKLDVFDIIKMGYAFSRLGDMKFSEDSGDDSLRLEILTKLNGLTHLKAHDALSDVIATIELLKLIKKNNPNLIKYSEKLQDKSFARKLLSESPTFYNISSFYGYEKKFTSVHHIICSHPTISNSLISWDLEINPENILNKSAQEIKEQMFAKKEDRIFEVGFSEIKLNQSPQILKYSEKNDKNEKRVELCQKNLVLVDRHKILLNQISEEIFVHEIPFVDSDADLFAGNFFGERKKDELNLSKSANNPVSFEINQFKSKRFSEQLFRLRGRNFFGDLNESEKTEYQEFMKSRINSDETDKWRTIKMFNQEYEEILKEDLGSGQKSILEKLNNYVQKQFVT
jgi:exodeoxyribonuclease I